MLKLPFKIPVISLSIFFKVPCISRFPKVPPFLRVIPEPLSTTLFVLLALIVPPSSFAKKVPSKFNSLFKVNSFEFSKAAVIFPVPE